MKKVRFGVVMLAVIAVVVSLTALAPAVSAAEESIYVTIANGELVLAYEEVSLTDADGDGKLTINDALINAHDKAFEGGADAGYGSSVTNYGLSLTKLWGVENGGGFGYFVNNVSAMSLGDTVKTGDHIVAFVYTDVVGYSDAYSYFDVTTSSESTLTLTLTASGYDANWAPVSNPVSGATITVDGKATEVKTDADGKATVTVSGEGRHVVSAISDEKKLVPPVCIVTLVSAGETTAPDEAPRTGSGLVLLCTVLAFSAVYVVSHRRARVK